MENLDNFLIKLKKDLNANRHSIPSGLYKGKAGVILFLITYLELRPEDIESQNSLYQLFEDINDDISNLPSLIESFGSSFCEGYSGILFCLELLRKSNFIDDEHDTFLEIDKIMHTVSDQFLKVNNWDPLYGVIGIGMYFLERGNQPAVQTIIDFFENTKKNIGDHIYYWECNHYEKGTLVDTGLAHGNIGIIYFLQKCVELGFAKNQCVSLLRGSFDFYLYIACFDKKTIWGYHLSHENVKESNINYWGGGRHAWCYGDLSIAYRLFCVASLLEKREIMSQMLQIMLTMSTQTQVEETNISDPFFCHGATGVMLLFNNLYEMTRNHQFRKASTYWFNYIKRNYSKDIGKNKQPYSILEGEIGWYYSRLVIENDVEIREKKIDFLNKIMFL